MYLQGFSQNQNLVDNAERLCQALYFGPPDWSLRFETVPFGVLHSIFGVGIYYFNSDERITVLVRENTELPAGTQTPLLELLATREALSEVFGPDIQEWSNCAALSIPEPEIHLAPGDPITSTQTGTCGAPVTWGNQLRGYLTAGHISPNKNAAVTDGYGNRIGKVAETWIPGQGPSGADIAVIELANQSTPPSSLRFTGPSMITHNSTSIDIQKNGGVLSAQVLGKFGWFYFPAVNGTYTDLYTTGNAVTQQGDSGSAANLAGSDELVGHVVGGMRGFTSLIQDANYQLSTIAMATGFNNISL
jgi:hypothetical protein